MGMNEQVQDNPPMKEGPAEEAQAGEMTKGPVEEAPAQDTMVEEAPAEKVLVASQPDLQRPEQTLDERMESLFVMFGTDLAGRRANLETKSVTERALNMARQNNDSAIAGLNMSNEAILRRVTSIEGVLQEFRAALSG